MSRVRWSSSASVTITQSGVVLCSDLGAFQLGGQDIGAFIEQVVPLLAEATECEAVVSALPAYSSQSVRSLLELLHARGMIEAAEEEPGRARRQGQDAFLRSWPAGADAAQRLAQAKILVAGKTPWTEWAASELRAAGVGTIRVDSGLHGVDASWLILATVDSDAPGELERLAASTYRSGAAAIWSHLAEGAAILGPVVVPGQTACRLCASTAELNPVLPSAPPKPTSGLAIAARMLGALLAMESSKLVSRYTPSDLSGRVAIRDFGTYRTTVHTVTRLPWCQICGA